jgi:hypothetical protein
MRDDAASTSGCYATARVSDQQEEMCEFIAAEFFSFLPLQGVLSFS